MTLFLHELKSNRLSLIIWSAAISFMLAVCVLIYPEIASQMDEMTEIFSNMGGFTAAFGMDQMNFGEFLGFFGVECGEVLGIGGALFAAIIGVSAISKEQKDGTAEFLLTHPVSRTKIVTQKLLAVYAQIIILNLVAAAVTAVSVLIIGESVEAQTLALMLLSYLLLQIEIASITFGISAFLKGKGIGIGLGVAMLFYFLNILVNMTEDAEFLKYITPFAYTEGGYIIDNNALKLEYLLVGAVFTVFGIVAAYLKYRKKDIT